MHPCRTVQEELSAQIKSLKSKCQAADDASECSTRMASRSWSLLSFFVSEEAVAEEEGPIDAADENLFSHSADKKTFRPGKVDTGWPVFWAFLMPYTLIR
eukprot:Skav228779  [mRNA]  locus=scaffold589:606112:606411:- [translate_table: standard]